MGKYQSAEPEVAVCRAVPINCRGPFISLNSEYWPHIWKKWSKDFTKNTIIQFGALNSLKPKFSSSPTRVGYWAGFFLGFLTRTQTPGLGPIFKNCLGFGFNILGLGWVENLWVERPSPMPIPWAQPSKSERFLNFTVKRQKWLRDGISLGSQIRSFGIFAKFFGPVWGKEKKLFSS